jgi:hypothetical protein
MKRADYDHVTGVINWPKEQWYVDWIVRKGLAECNKVGRHARKVGTRVDDLIMKSFESKKGITLTKKDGDDVRSAVRGWELWKERYEPRVLDWQVTEYDDALGVVGTRDFLCEIGGATYLVDIKCAQQIGYKYAVQISKYIQMLSRTPNTKDLYGGILRLDKMISSYEWISETSDEWIWDYEECLSAFDGLLKWMRLAKKEDEV